MLRLDFTRESSAPEGRRRRRLPWAGGLAHHEHGEMGAGGGAATYQGPRRRVLTLGVGGPVGSGKTALVESLCREFWPALDLAVITNDIYTREDAEFLARREVLP